MLSLVNGLRILEQGALFDKMTMSIEIERLVVGDEFQRINEEDDWRVFLIYTCEAGKVSAGRLLERIVIWSSYGGDVGD